MHVQVDIKSNMFSNYEDKFVLFCILMSLLLWRTTRRAELKKDYCSQNKRIEIFVNIILLH